MTPWKPLLGLCVALALTGCATTAPSALGDGAYGATVVSRMARTPGVLSEIDVVRAVQSSL